MMNKKLLLSGILLLSTSNILAQGLPDEINYSPYFNSYSELVDERDFTEDSLENNRSSLEQILDSIDSKYNYITLLNNQIREYENEILNLNSELPRRESDRRSTNSELNSVESEISRLEQRERTVNRNIAKERQHLRPVQSEKGEKERKLREATKELQKIQSNIKGNKSKLASNQAKIKSNKSAIEKAKAQIVNLNKKKTTLSKKLSELNSKKSQLESLLGKQNQQVKQLQSQHAGLKTKLDKEKAKLSKLVAANADASKISAQKAKVAAAKQAVAKVAGKIKAFKGKVSDTKRQISSTKAKISSTKSEISSIPGKISAQKSKQSKLVSQNSTLKTSNGQLKSKISSLQSKKSSAESKIQKHQKRIVELINAEKAIKKKITALTGRLQNVHRDLRSNESQRSGLINRITQLSNRIDQIRFRIPELERSVEHNLSEIVVSKSDIRSLKNQENITRRQIASLETELEQLIIDTNNAFDEYRQRKNLYSHYNSESQKLGSSQTAQAFSLGEENGVVMANSDSSYHGKVQGAQTGKFQAKMIGLVRGEISGYTNGYNAGYIDQDSIDTAIDDGNQDGKTAAYAYAKKVFKPVYFEKHMQVELKKSVNNKKQNYLVKSNISLLEESLDLTSGTIPNLTSSERNESLSKHTSLDASISKLFSEEKNIVADYEYFQNYQNTFETPSSIPYGNVNCSSVYKGLQHFKDICEQTYSSVFKSDYLDGSYQMYGDIYKELYLKKFDQVENKTRADEYQANYESSYDVSFSEAKVVGKKDVYDDTYVKTYNEKYDYELPLAKDFMNSKAKVEVKDWLKVKPIVTMSKSSFSNKSLKGGDKGFLEIDLKNISDQDSVSTGVVRIQNTKNLIFEKNVYSLIQVSKKSTSKLSIPFTVQSSAASKEEIKVQAQLDLPGDKYKVKRTEALNISQELILNPKINSDVIFDATPKVKGVFKYYVHKFTTTLSPAVESVKSGYNVSLRVVSDNSKLIKFKKSQFKTKTLARGEQAKVDLSYSFTKSAKGKTIELELLVTYKDLVVKKEKITLKPR